MLLNDHKSVYIWGIDTHLCCDIGIFLSHFLIWIFHCKVLAAAICHSLVTLCFNLLGERLLLRCSTSDTVGMNGTTHHEDFFGIIDPLKLPQWLDEFSEWDFAVAIEVKIADQREH